MLEEKLERKQWGVFGCTLRESFLIYGLGKNISCVFRGTFTVNKYEGKRCEGGREWYIFFVFHPTIMFFNVLLSEQVSTR